MSAYREPVVMRLFAVILVALVVSPFTAPFRTCGFGVIPDASANTMINTIASLSAPDDDAVGAVVVPRAGDFGERTQHVSSDRSTIAICPSALFHRVLRDGLAAPPAEHPSSVTVLRI
jgi:hypothetical protein